MQEARINYLWVGSFVLASGLLLLVGLALLAGRTGATDEYFTVFDRVPGISTGTRVLYNGYPVGQVEALEPVQRDGRQRFRVELSVQEGWAVAPDSVVHITSGLLSAVELDIRGESARAALGPGAEIKGREFPDTLSALYDAAGELSLLVEERVGPLLDDLSGRMPSIGANLEAVSADLADTSARVSALFDEENTARFESLLINAEQTSAGFAELAVELLETRDKLDAAIQTVAETVEANRGNVDQSLVELRYTLESVARHIDTFNENLEGTTRNMNEFSRQIRANPGVLLGGKAAPDGANGDR